MSAESHLRSEKITINISGRRFETLRSTLEKHPETLLGSNKRELFYDVDSKEYFFDRDSDAFKYILNYYRTGQLHHPRHECLTSFDEELKFYRVSPSVISHCCYGAYQNQKIRTNEEGKTVEELDATVPPPNNTRERIWRAFENPRSSTCASVLFGFIVSSIAVAILASVAASVPCGIRPGRAGTLSCGERYKIIFFLIKFVCVLIFTAEYLLRLYAAPSRLKFVPSFLGLIDLAAILSFYIGLVRNDSGDVSDLFIALRIFRALEILKFSSGFRTLNIKMKPLFAAFGFYVLTCIMIAIIFGTFIFMAEKNVDGTNFTSIPAGFLFAFASMTILGSFNMEPETIAGRFIAPVFSLSGLALLAVFILVLYNINRICRKENRAEKVELQKADMRI